MKIEISFGRRAKHSAEGQNEALKAALKAVSQELAREQAAHEETKQQLVEALGHRLVNGRRMGQALRVVEGGKARFQLEGQ